MPFYIPKQEGFENMGSSWRESEENQLLDEIKEGHTYDQISKAHKRTVGGITARLKQIALEQYKKEMPMDEIIKLTRISKNDLIDIIIRREQYEENKEKRKQEKITKYTTKPSESEVLAPNPKSKQVVELRLDTSSAEIAELKNEVLSLKKDVKEILRLMNAIYEFETQSPTPRLYLDL